MSILDRKQSQLALQRGNMGAFQSRLESATATLDSRVINTAGAESRIRDADIAENSAELVRRQILLQAGISVLAQANQQPALALTLLRG